MIKKKKKFPSSWSEKRIRRILEFYEQQSEDEGAAEIEAAAKSGTWMSVPRALVPAVRSLIARHGKGPVRRRNHQAATPRN